MSFSLAGLGWLLVALRLRRDRTLPRRVVTLLLVGAVLFVVPLPGRWVLVAIALSLLARAEPAAAPAAARAVP